MRHRLACLGEGSRFRIVMVLLRNAALSVSGIAREVGLSQSCTTRHLQALGAAGVVERARAGKEVRFALSRTDPDLVTLLGWIADAAPERPDSPPIAPPRAGPDPALRPRPRRRVARNAGIADTAAARASDADSSRRRSARKPASGAAHAPSALSSSEPLPASTPEPRPVISEPESRPWPPRRQGTDLEDFLL